MQIEIKAPVTASHRRVAYLVAALFTAVAACSTQTSTARRDTSAKSQRIVVDAPQELQEITGCLLRYQAARRRLPASLAELRTAGFIAADTHPDLDRYAYHRAGLGKLDDGLVILLVDHTFRIDKHLWCILQKRSADRRSAALDVTLVAISELYKASSAAK